MSKTLENGSFQDAVGTVVNGGTIEFVLSQDAMIIAGGQVAPTRVSATLDSSGDMPSAFTILANDELTPSGTFYLTTVFDSNGARVFGPERWVFSGSSPIDLDTMTPTIVDPAFANPILSNPTAAQAIEDFNLTTPLLNNIVVADGTKHTTVQAAIDAATAGDLVLVPRGTYVEALTVATADITLEGAGWGSIIKPSGSGVPITISAANVTVRNLQVDSTDTSAADAILSTASGTRIIGNKVVADGTDAVNNGRITISGAVTGFLIAKNRISGAAAAAIKATGGASDGRIVENEIASYRLGVYLQEDSQNITVSNNVFHTAGGSGVVAGYNCILSEGAKHVTITGNSCSDSREHGIRLSGGASAGKFSEDIIISGNVLFNVGDNGIKLRSSSTKQSQDIVISNNTILDGTSATRVGISIADTIGFVVTGNTVRNQSQGITLAGKSSDGVISHNVSTLNLAHGLGVVDNNGDISQVQISNNVLVNNNQNAATNAGLQILPNQGNAISDLQIFGNDLSDSQSSATQRDGLQAVVPSGGSTASNIYFFNNVARNNTVNQISVAAGYTNFERMGNVAGAGVDFLSLEGSTSAVPHWIFKQVDHTDMTAAATADTFTLWTLPANTMIHDIVGTVVTAWEAAVGLSAAVASVGTQAGAANDLTLDDNFFSAATVYELHDATASGGKGALLFDSTDKFAPYMFVAGGVIELQMDLTGDDHADTNAGRARIYALVSQPLSNTTAEAN